MPRYRSQGWIPAPPGPTPPAVKRFLPSEFSILPPKRVQPKLPSSGRSLRRVNSDPSMVGPQQHPMVRQISMPSVMTGVSNTSLEIGRTIPNLPYNDPSLVTVPALDPFRTGPASLVQSPVDSHYMTSEMPSSDSMHSAMSEGDNQSFSSNYAPSRTSDPRSRSTPSHSSSSSGRNESRLSSRTVRRVPDDVIDISDNEENPYELTAHPIEDQNVPTPPFWSTDTTPPSFLPNDLNVLPPNVTRDWEDPIGIAEYEGAAVFTGRPIAPQLPPNTARYRETTSSAIPTPSGARPYMVDRSGRVSSSSSSAGPPSVHSDSSNVLPLPPRGGTLSNAPIIQPSHFQSQQQRRQPSRLTKLAQSFKIKKEK